MADAIKSDIRTLLAAARRGDFSALLAAADYWEENDCAAQLAAWKGIVERCRWYLENRDRVRMGVLESMTRWVRDWLYDVNSLEGRPWKLPAHRNRVGTYRKIPSWMGQHRARTETARLRCWEWCRDMADALIKYVKAHPEANS